MIIGYARVSSDDQSLDLQRDALKQAGCDRLYEEKESGGRADRPELQRLMEALRSGDTLVVWRLDRLGRSLKHLVETVEKLEAAGVGFKSVTEAIDTTTSGRLPPVRLAGRVRAGADPGADERGRQGGAVAGKAGRQAADPLGGQAAPGPGAARGPRPERGKHLQGAGHHPHHLLPIHHRKHRRREWRAGMAGMNARARSLAGEPGLGLAPGAAPAAVGPVGGPVPGRDPGRSVLGRGERARRAFVKGIPVVPKNADK